MLLRQRCYVCMVRKEERKVGGEWGKRKEMGESRGGEGDRWSWKEEKIAH